MSPTIQDQIAHAESSPRTETRINDLMGPRLAALSAKAPIYAAVGIVLCIAGMVLSPGTFFQSYLYAFMFWFGVTIGSMAWLMGHHVTGGGWGFILRRPLEAATRCWPYILGMFVPIIIAMFLSMPDGHHGLYEWADPKIVAGDRILTAKSGYLNPLGWLLRAGIYFVIWFALTHFLNKWSREEDLSDDPSVRHRLSLMSGWGLIIFLLTTTFATIDWVMTLEPHWYSSLWGAIFLVGQAHSTLCLMIVLIRRLGHDLPVIKNVEKRYFRDIGNLMLAFTLFWAYTNYAQFMIQYSANIAEEATWQLHRTTFGWQYIGLFTIIFHFAVPFLFLLMSLTKVNIYNLAKLAMVLIVTRHIDLWYYTVPTFRQSPWTGMPFSLLADLGAPLALGGLWLWQWSVQMRKENAPIVPQFDPRLEGFWPLPEVSVKEKVHV
ncbi:quinol:cytochrome c oxidoreductase quinone-binding subunit 2 [Abditibacterium utsteinense]|uniref:Quinol:cytochrome c oxidoreductase quinone-binding subunit 2 n=1 Tax=Abditibacterium utsteinense TaxID=1960156 RepID=A0A2S8SV03_9BACT|nr:hypothetical protein [Abditibacterium utsteinense]PQV64623.1 quinol:cytochrome c oxidoreductase quinone-binding subunit 2 [Abditibacterium utsteinense]